MLARNRSRSRRFASYTLLAPVAFLSIASSIAPTTAFAAAGADTTNTTIQAATEQVQILAESPSEDFSAPVTDNANMLTDAEIEQLEEGIADFEANDTRTIHIIYVTSFDGITPEVWATQAVMSIDPEKALVLAVSFDDNREIGVNGGSLWSDDTLVKVFDNALAALSNNDWYGGAQAAIDAAENSTAASASTGTANSEDTNSGAGMLWLGLGALAVGGAGIGIWYSNRRSQQKKEEQTLDYGRNLPASESQALKQLSIPVLENLANEELVSTDESIRHGEAQLLQLEMEFGAERTRAFRQSLDHSQATLQRAFGYQQQLLRGQAQTELERRSLLQDIISQCRAADEALAQQASEFQRLQEMTAQAPEKITQAVQRSVELHARIPQAEAQLAALEQQYAPNMLTSVRDNIALAQASMEKAEKSLSEAQTLSQQPLGQQHGLVDAIQAATQGFQHADDLLLAIEHAQENIQAAQSGLAPLMEEVQEEITAATNVRNRNAHLPQVDWQQFDAAVVGARQALAQARNLQESDPVRAWTDLTAADSALDIQLDVAQGSAMEFDRNDRVYQQQYQAAQQIVGTAADFITTRGQVIGSRARALLRDAQQQLEHAASNRASDIRTAIAAASHAASLGQAALQAAQRDVDNYQRQQRNSGGTGGAFIAGMLANEILSGSRSRNRGFGGGGYGGGFGGSFGGPGGGRGGSFGGGIGGGRGGSF
ncbi:MAG: TPM domain-containing protein [Corynebacterium sp.]|nr:TPM domain-containing protein [Corynebacterium sp.]